MAAVRMGIAGQRPRTTRSERRSGQDGLAELPEGFGDHPHLRTDVVEDAAELAFDLAEQGGEVAVEGERGFHPGQQLAMPR